MARLGAKHLRDRASGVHDMEKSLEDRQAKQAEALAAQEAVVAQRDALLGALASAVPQLHDGGDPIAVALARLAWLQAQRSQAVAAATKANAPPVEEAESHVPTEVVLKAVAAGARALTREQREWCVGEAMVSTGFQFTPVELLDKGDAHLAKLVLGAASGT